MSSALCADPKESLTFRVWLICCAERMAFLTFYARLADAVLAWVAPLANAAAACSAVFAAWLSFCRSPAACVTCLLSTLSPRAASSSAIARALLLLVELSGHTQHQ